MVGSAGYAVWVNIPWCIKASNDRSLYYSVKRAKIWRKVRIASWVWSVPMWLEYVSMFLVAIYCTVDEDIWTVRRGRAEWGLWVWGHPLFAVRSAGTQHSENTQRRFEEPLWPKDLLFNSERVSHYDAWTSISIIHHAGKWWASLPCFGVIYQIYSGIRHFACCVWVFASGEKTTHTFQITFLTVMKQQFLKVYPGQMFHALPTARD